MRTLFEASRQRFKTGESSQGVEPCELAGLQGSLESRTLRLVQDSFGSVSLTCALFAQLTQIRPDFMALLASRTRGSSFWYLSDT